MIEKNSYNPTEWEEDIYSTWLKAGAFSADENSKKPPFSIIMPPPNVTSQAHIGHAMDMTYQDILIRYKRMHGYNCLWQPGTDHAALATEAKIVEKLTKQGKTKEQIGREEFDKLAWEWYDYYGDRILKQFNRLGFSADWDRYKFTMDKTSTNAVLETFVNLFNKNLIYRGKRQTNWCLQCKSVISDDEVVYSDEPGSMWHIKYPFADGTGYITVATTRPETLFGDTAVAVNPNDKRYTKIVGKMLKLPLTTREIPIIADEYVDASFGTGMVKITPAHDPNDYEVGKRHNLEMITVILKDGTLSDAAGKFKGLNLKPAREAVVNALEEQGLLEKVENHSHNVGHCERCHTAVEPMITEQWFVAMKELVKPAIKVVKSGELQIHPKRFEKNYFHWLENIQDWCISRQIWTGHRIPIYYCDNCGNTLASKTEPTVCPKCNSHKFTHDPDVLDTWFSSALWPFSTLGWPEKTKELEMFYPTDVLVTAFDILTQWVTKMVYMGFECMGKTPFKHCLIHGLVRDSKGRKMSKSLGNGVDPLEVVSNYGADALRLVLIKDMSMGMDTRFDMSKLETSRAFINKLWNASKFIDMHSQGETIKNINDIKLNATDSWVLYKLGKLINSVNTNFDKFDVGIALTNIYSFVLDTFCDWYIEFSKPYIFAGGEAKQSTVSVLNFVLESVLKLLHPFIPFVTEYIYLNMPILNPQKELILTSSQTAEFAVDEYQNDFTDIEFLIDTIKKLRNLKIENNFSISDKCKVATTEANKKYESVINKLAGVELCYDNLEGAVIITELGKFTLGIKETSVEEVLEQLTAQCKAITFEIERSTKMLSNAGFVQKAPAKLIEEEKTKLANNQAKLNQLTNQIELVKNKA